MATVFRQTFDAAQKLLRKLPLLLVAGLFVTGCMSGGQLAFAPADGGLSRDQSNARKSTAAFDKGAVVLAAPSGFCFDPQMEQQIGEGGFAMLARCDRLRGRGRRLSPAALITATVGGPVTTESAADGTIAEMTPPSAQSLHQAAARARSDVQLLETRNDRQLPLVKLQMTPDDSLPGASGTHWRGVFVVDGHLVVVALYAPKGSPYLGDRGARLIREFGRASRTATQLNQGTTAKRF